MDFDLEQIDRLLTTTRAVRRRLDLEREVPDELLRHCIDLAEQAPTGGDVASRRWLVIRDPETKQRVAELYRQVGGEMLRQAAERMRGTDKGRVWGSSSYLADHLHEVPVLVIVTIRGVHDGSGRPGLFDSVLQAAWSFCLALRARGLGTAWTTLHLGRAREVAELLGIPDDVTQCVLLPVAWTVGTEFSPAPRRPASEVMFVDQWGHTSENPSSDGLAHLADGPGVTVEVDIAARPEAVWELVADVDLPGRFSTEFLGGEWVEGDTPGVGARFHGRNRLEGFGEWETTCHVTAWNPPAMFAWHVIDPDDPGARWRFELEPVPGGTRLRQSVVIGPGVSGTSRMIEREPEREQEILAWRRADLRRNMTLTVEGIKGTAEAAGQD